MHIEYMKEFIVLAQTLNFTNAAKQLGLAQSALSKHVQSMEVEFGAPLFMRNKHTTELTRAGRVLFDEASTMYSSYVRAKTQIAELEKTQVLRFGGLSQNTEVLGLVSYMLAQLEDEGITIPLVFIQNFPKAFLQQLKDDEADLVVSYLGPFEQLELDYPSLFLWSDPFVAVMRSDHPLADRPTLRPTDLEGQTIIQLGSNYFRMGWATVRDYFEHAGVSTLKRTVFAQSIVDVATVNVRNDILIMSRSSMAGLPFTTSSSYRCTPIDDCDARFDIYAIMRDDSNNASLVRFWKALTAHIEEYRATHRL